MFPYPAAWTLPSGRDPRWWKICFGAVIRIVPGACVSAPVSTMSIWYWTENVSPLSYSFLSSRRSGIPS